MTTEDLAKLCEALSHETRVKIIKTLSTGTATMLSVGQIADVLGISHSSTSRHLQVLQRVGLVDNVQSGKYAMYCVHSATLVLINTEIANIILNSQPTEEQVNENRETNNLGAETGT